MWKHVLSYFWSGNGKSKASIPLDEAYNVIRECEEKLSSSKVKDVKEAQEIGTYEVSTKIGKVTHVFEDTYRVDDLHDFKTDLCDTTDIFVGTKITYQLIKSEGETQVVNVGVIEHDWDVIDTGKKTWHERTLVCSVLSREGRILTLTPGDIEINLNNVCSEFIPIPGDWVELSVKCEIDEGVIDLTGKIIEINKLQPLRPQVKVGKVSLWNANENRGLMDKNIFFDKESLNCGYCPVRGDKIVAEIIESNQGNCAWRAVKIIPHYLHALERKTTNGIKDEDLKDSHDGLSITDNVSLTFTKLYEVKLFLVEVEFKEEIQLICVEVPKINGQCRLTDVVDHFKIEPNCPLTLKFECKAATMGETRELLIFHFENFKIRRWVTINVASSRPTYIKKHRKNDKQVVAREYRQSIKGPRVGTGGRFMAMRTPDYPVSEKLFNLILKYWRQPYNYNVLKNELEKIKPCLATALTYMNFEDKFHTLVHLNEIHTMIEMQKYDQERAVFIKSGEYLLLEIENLAERRPSVIIGDRIIARNITDSNQPDYEGYIHRIAKNHAYIKFSHDFHHMYDGEDYSVFVVGSRVTHRRKHHAVNMAVKNLGKDWLFPTKVTEKEPQIEFVFDSYTDSMGTSNGHLERSPESSHCMIAKKRLLKNIQKFQDNKVDDDIPIRKLEWYNNLLNFYQKEAVRNILLGVCRPLPYIIFGPPGTGKTITIVETVLQILRLMPHSRILLCAPSNSAADLLALRLIASGVLKPGDLIRLVAMTAVPGIPAKLAPYCATANVEKEGTEFAPPVVTPSGLVLGYSSKVLGRHRVTVCTCSTSGVLYSMGYPKGHFSHIIVDEAGQTSEPSLLIPLAFLDSFSGQAILAGDPMQLGPVVLSRLACEYGLEESFLERLSTRFPYMRDSRGFPDTCGYDPRLITKLIYNYRSLPTLLKLPSQLFYNDDLKPIISETNSPEADILHQVKEILPKTRDGKLASIVFHGVKGENFQAEDSPSWFNPNEASQVFYYVNELYRLGLSASDIGVITPYKAQTKQLMELFKEAEFDFPKLGTVEEFQGQEFNVIIVSTVRSSTKYVTNDLKYCMGFIASPRRLNVSITRAKSLLIIVGNPELLVTDRCWSSVLNYCNEKGGFIGCTECNEE